MIEFARRRLRGLVLELLLECGSRLPQGACRLGTFEQQPELGRQRVPLGTLMRRVSAARHLVPDPIVCVQNL